jgi:hypothetical protein
MTHKQRTPLVMGPLHVRQHVHRLQVGLGFDLVDRITFHSGIVRRLAPIRADLAAQMRASDIPKGDVFTVHKRR